MSPALVVLLLLAQSIAATETTSHSPVHPTVAAAYVPQRVFDGRRRTFTDFESMLADLARADVILVGEQHDDPNTHRLEAAVLQGLLRRRVSVTVSLEMFERDVQPTIDAYLDGSLTEEAFMKASRPWPRYATDYRSLVEFAKGHGWRVVAANVPRKYAMEVAKAGLTALDTLNESDRATAARDLQCPLDAYFDRFAETMNSHPQPGTSAAEQRAVTERYFQSQCVKDETMAESIAGVFARQEGRPGVIVHFNGAFHSDYGQGTTERVRRRLANRRVATMSILPVSNLDDLAPAGTDMERADYIVYTIGKPGDR